MQEYIPLSLKPGDFSYTGKPSRLYKGPDPPASVPPSAPARAADPTKARQTGSANRIARRQAAGRIGIGSTLFSTLTSQRDRRVAGAPAALGAGGLANRSQGTNTARSSITSELGLLRQNIG